jgi:hypothetical protein
MLLPASPRISEVLIRHPDSEPSHGSGAVWSPVEQTRDGGCEQHAARLAARLGAVPTRELMDESYRWDLWGCGLPGQRRLLRLRVRISMLTPSQGRATPSQASPRDPDVLALHSQLQDPAWRPGWDYLQRQDIGPVASRAFEAVTGQDSYPAIGD